MCGRLRSAMRTDCMTFQSLRPTSYLGKMVLSQCLPGELNCHRCLEHIGGRIARGVAGRRSDLQITSLMCATILGWFFVALSSVPVAPSMKSSEPRSQPTYEV